MLSTKLFFGLLCAWLPLSLVVQAQEVQTATQVQLILYDLREPMNSNDFIEQIEQLLEADIHPYVVISPDAKYNPFLLNQIQTYYEAELLEVGLAATALTTEEMLAKKPAISDFTFKKLVDFEQEFVFPTNVETNKFLFITDNPGEMAREAAQVVTEPMVTFVINPQLFSLSTIELLVPKGKMPEAPGTVPLSLQSEFSYFQPVGPYAALEGLGFVGMVFFTVWILIFTATVLVSRIVSMRKFQREVKK